MTRKKILFLLILSFFSLLSIFIICFEYHEISRLHEVGKLIEAKVRYKHRPSKGYGGVGSKIIDYSNEWILVYYFQPLASNKEYRGEAHVTRATYEKIAIGSKIKVTYNPNQPLVSYYGDLRNISSSSILNHTSISVLNVIFMPLCIFIFIIFFIIEKKLALAKND